MADFDKWIRKPETCFGKEKCVGTIHKCPNADKPQFYVQTSVDEKYRISAEVFLNESTGSSVSVFGSDRKYWSQTMKTALGLIGEEGFPFQLSPLKTKTALPIPAVDFTEPAPSIAKIFNQENRIYATPDEFFVTKFCGIFQQTRLTHIIGRSENLVKRAKHEILATAAKLFGILCDAGMRNFLRNL